MFPILLGFMERLERVLRSEKRVAGIAEEGPSEPGPATPHCEAKKSRPVTCWLLDLPDELLERVVASEASVESLACLACTHPRLKEFAEAEGLWHELYGTHWGASTEVTEIAAELAGSWKTLFAAKVLAARAAAPWERPSLHEVEAAVRHMAGQLPGAGGTLATAQQYPGRDDELCVVFLVDGSGSVTEEDFGVMQGFLNTAARLLGMRPALLDATGAATSAHEQPELDEVVAEEAATVPLPRLAVVQFSNDTRVERALGPAPTPGSPGALEYEALVAGMRRMNGGTNIAAAVQKAGQLLKPVGRHARRVLALLTDGRVDSYQAREACEMAQRMADEQGPVSLYAFGVGRGVDKSELLRIVGSTIPSSPSPGRPAGGSSAGGWHGAGAAAGVGSLGAGASSHMAAGGSGYASLGANTLKEAESRYLGLCVLDEAPW